MMRFSTLMRVALATLATCAVSGLGAPGALAATPSPGWTINSFATPTNFASSDEAECYPPYGAVSGCDMYTVTATNAGSMPTDGSTVTLNDTVPAGLSIVGVRFYWSELGYSNVGEFLCTIATATSASCSIPSFYFSFLPPVSPDGTLRMEIFTTANESGVSIPHATNTASVSGGGAPEASATGENSVESAPPSFGISSFSSLISGLDGAPDTQAGDHPYELTTRVDFNNALKQGLNRVEDTSVEDVKDIVVDLPLGFIGSTLAAPQCTFAQLSTQAGCPPETKVGELITRPEEGSLEGIHSGIYNMVPEQGVPAELGYIDAIKGAHPLYTSVVPTPAGYVLRVTAPDIPQVLLNGVITTIYGDPAQRDGTGNAPIPFFTNPTDCSGQPVVTTVHVDSWQHPGRLNPDGTPDFSDHRWISATSSSPPVSGCDALRFPAQIKAQPTTHESDKPSGMNFEIELPQSETMGVVATPTLKKVAVTLPEGFTIDPSAGDGLQACSEAQIGWLGGSHLNFSPAAPQCPEASKIGSLELETPLVPRRFEGEMFLARQGENPFGTTLAAYVVVHDPVTGVLIKIAGEFLPDPHTGRLTALFDENPNLPFSDLKLHFFGGPRAELATPERCGTFTTTSELTPWSAPDSGAPATPFDSFVIDEACPSGFSPTFTAGSLNLQAGAYTPFVASFQRSDADQELAGLTVTLPPGLIANLSGVTLCSDAQVRQARAGMQGCPESSQVGSVQAGAGPGPNPLFVAGKAYLTGPYNGGPYGLAVVVPAIAGPFDFGTVVVRQSLRIDQSTAQVSDVSDPFPTIIDGIPLRLRRVDVRLERGGFTFNPTSCSKFAFTGSISGFPLGAPTTLAGSVGFATQPGATTAFSAPFQVTNCATLGFKPQFSVATSAHHTRTGGDSLHVKLTYPKAPFGSQANVAKVRVELPMQLPSRLTTLQKACTDTVFNANPENCPAASKVGEAIATTPIIPEDFRGPAYFVSHGGVKFPELIIALHGYALTVDLHGETFISKEGVTSTTFNTVPDVPIGTFELILPAGPDSALAANGDLCGSKLVMPTTFTAQNGATISQRIPISVEGCAPAIRVLRHSVKGKHATVVVSVPSAGRLIADGGGVLRSSRVIRKAGTVTLTLGLSRSEQHFVAHHHNRRLKVPIKLSFTPAHGGQLSARVAVLMR